jgi:hypothetical protein
MARTAQPRQQPVSNDLVEAVNEVDTLALNQLTAGARQVIETYGLKSANPDILITEIRGFQQTAVDALFQIGARLQLLHAVTPHGEWIQRLESLNMIPRTAQRIVQATVKYVGDGKHRSEQLLSLGKSKLLELMVLDDDELDVLDAGGQVGELDLDDVARMGVTELRQALREAKHTIDAKNTLILKKDDKINTLDEKLTAAKRFKPSADSEAKTQQEQATLEEVSAAVREVELGFARLAVVVGTTLETCSNEAIRAHVAEKLRYVQARIDECARENGFEKLEGSYTPEWLGSGGKAKK